MPANHFKWRLVDWPLCQHSTVSRRKRVHAIIWLPKVPRRAARGCIWSIYAACAVVNGLLILLRRCASIEFRACHDCVAAPLPVCVVLWQNLYPAVVVNAPDWHNVSFWIVCYCHALNAARTRLVRWQIGGVIRFKGNLHGVIVHGLHLAGKFWVWGNLRYRLIYNARASV